MEVQRPFKEHRRKLFHVFQMLQQGGDLKSGRGYLTLDWHEIGLMLIFQLLEKVAKIFSHSCNS
jgi:hypothetical protein